MKRAFSVALLTLFAASCQPSRNQNFESSPTEAFETAVKDRAAEKFGPESLETPNRILVGDMVLRYEQALPYLFNREEQKELLGIVSTENLLLFSSERKWKDGKVPIEASGAAQEDLEKVILLCNAHWGLVAKIECRRRRDEKRYVKIVRSDRNSSEIGPEIGLGIVPGLPDVIDFATEMKLKEDVSDRTIVHELGHALGFRHEHQREDRNQFVRVNSENRSNGLKESDFERRDGIFDEPLGRYDFRSVMHYGNYIADSSGPDLFEIKPPFEYVRTFGPENNKPILSFLDADGMGRKYKRREGWFERYFQPRNNDYVLFELNPQILKIQGKFVQGTGSGKVVRLSDNIGGLRGTFRVKKFTGNRIALETLDGYRIAARQDNDVLQLEKTTDLSRDQVFEIFAVTSEFALRARNGKFVTVNDNGVLTATSNQPYYSELFTFLPNNAFRDGPNDNCGRISLGIERTRCETNHGCTVKCFYTVRLSSEECSPNFIPKRKVNLYTGDVKSDFSTDVVEKQEIEIWSIYDEGLIGGHEIRDAITGRSSGVAGDVPLPDDLSCISKGSSR